MDRRWKRGDDSMEGFDAREFGKVGRLILRAGFLDSREAV